MKPRPVKITAVLNGYIVEVGCSMAVFSSKKKLLKELSRYLDDPATVESEYTKEATATSDSTDTIVSWHRISSTPERFPGLESMVTTGHIDDLGDVT